MTEIIVDNKKRFLLPDSWDELTYEQLYSIAIHIFEYNIVKEEATKAYLRTKIVVELSGFCGYSAKNEFLQSELALKVLPVMDWMFDRNLLTRQLLPSIRIRKKFSTVRFHAPSDNFNNLTFEEFDDAEYWFIELMNPDTKQREKALNMLCAILYRPYLQTAVDNRIPYHATENEPRAEWFSYCDTRHKLCVLLWYMGCRNALTDQFHELFSGKGDGEGNWTMLAHSLAGPVLGDIDKVNKSPIRKVLTEMLRLYRQGEDRAAAEKNAEQF